MGEKTNDKKMKQEQEAPAGTADTVQDGEDSAEARAADVSGEAQPEGAQDGVDIAGGNGGAEMAPEQKIANLEAQVAELNDQYLRKAADFENFRKRMNREKQDAIDFANQSLILDLIPVIDDFERAIKAAETAIANASADGAPSKDFTALYEGISMTEKRLITQLENRWTLKRYDSAGEVFDPNLHEALMMEKSADVTEATVQEEWSKGYTLKDRVIRTAKVKVLMPADNSTADTNGNAASGAPADGNSGAETSN
jgi:molecular chaperone GrpE